jgi:anthranilate synthase/aminodeoxychorismate synthase-like glutamine amidotransferase
MFLLIDNYDSFVHNLARYFEIGGATTRTVRNDELSIDDIQTLAPSAIILSPGPRSPDEAGLCVDLIRALGPRIPILGVCLGHQCIAQAYGARVERANAPVHGKASLIVHDYKTVFRGLPSPLRVGRYHSLIARGVEETDLRIHARTQEGEIMAFSHAHHPVYGVQFHPESILTEHGQTLINNFIALARSFAARKDAA